MIFYIFGPPVLAPADPSEAMLGYSARSRGPGLESWWRSRLLAAARRRVRIRAPVCMGGGALHGMCRWAVPREPRMGQHRGEAACWVVLPLSRGQVCFVQ